MFGCFSNCDATPVGGGADSQSYWEKPSAAASGAFILPLPKGISRIKHEYIYGATTTFVFIFKGKTHVKFCLGVPWVTSSGPGV